MRFPLGGVFLRGRSIRGVRVASVISLCLRVWDETDILMSLLKARVLLEIRKGNKMKRKTVRLVAGLVLVVGLSGCHQESIEIPPSIVAEDFVKAIIQRNPSGALDLCDIALYDITDGENVQTNSTNRFLASFDPTRKSKSEIRKLKDEFERAGEKIDDDKLEGIAIMEVVKTPSEFSPTYHVDGREYTGEEAEVTVQYGRGKDNYKKSNGMKVRLIKVDGLWKVIGYSAVSGLDDAD